MNLKSDIAAQQMAITSMSKHRKQIGRHCEKATQILFYQIAGRADKHGPINITEQELDDLSTAVNGITSIINWKEGE